MIPSDLWQRQLQETGRDARYWLIEWWQLVQLGAMILVLTLSPSSYAASSRGVLARHIYLNTAPILLGFTVFAALVTVVITRIVLVTALSYGLSQFALQVVIRVLVIELIPLTAALFVALRCTIPDGAELSALQASGRLEALRQRGIDPVSTEVLPRVVALVVAYLAVYGFNLAGTAAFTRLFGQVFSPAVSLIFVLKTFFFCLAVSLIPMASALYGMGGITSVRASPEIRGLVRMFSVLLMVEVVSLIGNYY